MPATSASLLRNEWSPSTRWHVTGPGMPAVSRSSSSGLAKASRSSRDEQARQVELAEVLGAEALGTARGVERVADQDQRSHTQAPGSCERAHAAAEGAAADGDPRGGDRKPFRQCGGGGANRLNADGRRVRASLSGGLRGKLDPLDGHAGARHRLVDGDEPRLLTAGARPRGEDEPGCSRLGHRTIVARRIAVRRRRRPQQGIRPAPRRAETPRGRNCGPAAGSSHARGRTPRPRPPGCRRHTRRSRPDRQS